MSGLTITVGLESHEGESRLESDGKVVSEYTEVYLLKTNSLSRPSDAAITAALGILPGSPNFDDPNATCHRVHIGPGPEKTRPPNLAYLVTVQWATNAPLNDSTDTDPTTRRTLWSVKPTIQQRFIIRDNTNKLIVNTAGQPFDGGIPVDVRLGTVVATRNVDGSGYDKTVVLANSGKVNSATYLGGAIGAVQVDIESVEKYEGAYHFWEETYTFTYDPLGHQPNPASAGFFQRQSVGSNTLVRIQQGTPPEDVTEPEPLDTNGILVPIASRPGSCAFVAVNYFGTMDFATFGL